MSYHPSASRCDYHLQLYACHPRTDVQICVPVGNIDKDMKAVRLVLMKELVWWVMFFLMKVTDVVGRSWDMESGKSAVCSAVHLREWLKDTLYSGVLFGVGSHLLWMQRFFLWHSDLWRASSTLGLFLWFKPCVTASVSREMMTYTPVGLGLAQ